MDKESTVPQWERWRRLAAPSLFLLGVIYYEELFLKLYCFRALTAAGALFTLLFTLPVALLLGLLCGGVPEQRGQRELPPLGPELAPLLAARTVWAYSMPLKRTFQTGRQSPKARPAQ